MNGVRDPAGFGPGAPIGLPPGGGSLRPGQKPEEVAKEFEALLLKELVSSMRATAMSQDGESNQLVDHLVEENLARHIADSGGVGLASLVVDQVGDPQVVVTPTDHQLRLDRWVREGLAPEKPIDVKTERPSLVNPLQGGLGSGDDEF